MAKNIVFDVIGTLVGYEKFYAAIESTLGDRLRAQGVKSDFFGFAWTEVAEREYVGSIKGGIAGVGRITLPKNGLANPVLRRQTYLSMSGRYVQSSTVFQSMFYRVLWKAGIPDPRKFATDEDLAVILQGYADLEMRPGARECVQKLRDAGFTVWGFTMGDIKRVSRYFERSGIEMPADNLRSCDQIGVGKPSPKAYEPLLRQLSGDGSQPWFAAAHLWDTSAAKRTGYRGAFCTVWEGEALPDIFGDVDVLADSLPEMADKVIAAT